MWEKKGIVRYANYDILTINVHYEWSMKVHNYVSCFTVRDRWVNMGGTEPFAGQWTILITIG